ncbi:pentapeptide repeat-containing protein [Paraburkholderia fungorum]|uniref:pentapeptide repeat-containing protein n=1 Tax=Paraburkholderia fungorum TaxID=134537 RepID=UPI001C1EA9D2|nr:pentapeptide repeat-containing protein [Paraburkholderia fungorum]
MAITDCTFDHCTLEEAQFKDSTLGKVRFNQCSWNGINLDHGQWSDVHVLGCTGTAVEAHGLKGERVDFR